MDIEKQLLQDIDNELEKDRELKELAEKIARDFMFKSNGESKFEFLERYFSAKAKYDVKQSIIVITDRQLYEIYKEKYKPFIVKGDNDTNFTKEENLKATIETFLRHLSGDMCVGEM